jgi:hypothetical protein
LIATRATTAAARATAATTRYNKEVGNRPTRTSG